jgi:hypothetical protein
MTGLADYLAEKGLLSRSALARADEVMIRTRARLPSTLVRLGLVADSEVAQALADLHELPLASRAVLAGERVAIDGLNPRFLARHAVLPLSRTTGRSPTRCSTISALALSCWRIGLTTPTASAS